MHVKHVLVILLAALVVTASGFVVDPWDDRESSAVPFDETLTLGLTGVDVRQAESEGYSVPKAEVFFAQYQYVVGYYGIESAADHLQAEHTTQQFGRPLTVLVSDYTDTDPRLTDEGYLTLDTSRDPGWVDGHDASFVVDSRARTPGGPAAVPFSSESAAREFAERADGTVVEWDALRSRQVDQPEPAETMARRVADRTAWADRQVERTAPVGERPVSVVVGEDAKTLDAAVEQAPPNTTVRLPPGTYDGNLTIDKPITLSGVGEDSHVSGDGTGTVVRVAAPNVGVTDLRISGVGPNGTRSLAQLEDDQWDARIRVAYGRGDSAIRFDNATGSLVSGVHVDTQATGLLVRNSPGTVVRDSSIEGTEEWTDGFMGVLAMFEPIVVQNTTMVGGRDGVYTHHTPGIVVRDSHMEQLRYGIHEMYTSQSLLTDNTMRETNAGIIVMTRPRGNVLRNNDVRDSRIGLSIAGSASFVDDNVVVDNERGLSLGATRSLVSGNAVVGNDVGIKADTLMPSNTVVGNDVVANGVQVDTGRGPVRIWTDDGRGNYWGRLPGRDATGDGTIDAAYHPTGSVDESLLSASGAISLRESPAVSLIRAVQDSVPGLRSSGVLDNAPLVHPVNRDVVDTERERTE